MPPDLKDQLHALWPDTNVRWLPPTERALQLQTWTRQVVGWLRLTGATVDEVLSALEGAVAWVEQEKHAARKLATYKRKERRKCAP